MSDPARPAAPPDLTPPAPRAPAAGNEPTTAVYFAGRASQTTTTTGGASTTTTEVAAVGGLRYTSADRNGNGTADTTVDAGGFVAQRGAQTQAGLGVEARHELSERAFVFGRVQVTPQETRAALGLTATFGGAPRRESPTEATSRALDRELRDVFRDPAGVRERVEALDRGTHPQGLTFGEIAGRLYEPERAGLVAADGLTERGAREPERLDVLVAYANHREADLARAFAREPAASDFRFLVAQKETLIGGFQQAYGAAWSEPYARFNETQRSAGIDAALAGLPAGTSPEATDRLRNALGAQHALEARYPEGLVVGAREQAEIGQFRRDIGAPTGPVPERVPAAPAAERGPER